MTVRKQVLFTLLVWSSAMRYINFILFISIVITTLSQKVATSITETSSSHCITTDKYSSCYDHLNIAHGLIPTFENSLYDIFMEMRVFVEQDEDVNFRALHSCEVSARRKFTLSLLGAENFTASIIIIRPNFCKSTGNILGFFYEAISFGLSNGYLVGRLDPLPTERCGNEGRIGSLESYLPRLFIPKNLSRIHLRQSHCRTIDKWPWQDPQSYFWNTTDVIEKINTKMMRDYSSANIPTETLGNSLSESVGVHFRCGDSLQHPNYGIIPFHVYRELFSKLAIDYNTSKYIIYTDVNKHVQPYGQLCWNLLGELQQTIHNTVGLKHTDVNIQFSTFSHAISMLHMSKVIVCSVSTFCFFSSYGSNIVYQPAPVLLFRYPNNSGIINHANKILFSSKLLSPRDFPYLSFAQFIDMTLNETDNHTILRKITPYI